MSQRRTVAKPTVESVETTLSLDDPTEVEPLAPSSNDDHFDDVEGKIKRWKESPFASGLTQPSWMEERTHYDRGTIPGDETGCLWISAWICPMFHAKRVGNMVVLRSSLQSIETSVVDEETGNTVVERTTRPKLDVVVGPYWPMMACITYPLILGVSAWTLWSGIVPGHKPVLVVLVWFLCTVTLIIALAFTACTDPGIVYRTPEAPNSSWRWTEQASSFRPPKAWFDADTRVVVEEFDHT